MKKNAGYPWKRFWVPQNESYGLYFDYLPDPEDEYQRFLNENVKSLEEYDKYPCLVLLGEPGSGKSYAIQEYTETIRESEKHVIFEDLKGYSSEERVEREIFSSETFKQWKKNTDDNLYIILDSLDEGFLNIKTIYDVLYSNVERLPLERAYLRIVSRTADWHSTFEKKLMGIYREDNFKILEIAPLRFKDVQLAASTELGNNSKEFLESLNKYDLQPISFKPIGLISLLRIWKSYGSLPASRYDVFKKICRIYCDEVSLERKEKYPDNLDPDQKLIVASKIAFLTFFTRKNLIHKPNRNTDSKQLEISKIMGGKEKSNNLEFNITYDLVKKTLSCALFEGSGKESLTWIHKSFEEFLAAEYIILRSPDCSKIEQLLFSSYLGMMRLKPKYFEIVSWIAARNSHLLDQLIETNPIILLNNDHSHLSQDDLTKILKSILKNIERIDYQIELNAYGKNLWRLKFEGIEKMLNEYLVDSKSSFWVKKAVIEIIEKCKLSYFHNFLIETSLNKNEDLIIRCDALQAIKNIEEKKDLKRIIPIAKGIIEDKNDNMKGYALEMLWPETISTEELLNYITEPKMTNYTGIYMLFIGYKLPIEMIHSDLVIALNWLRKQPLDFYRDSKLKYFVREIVKKTIQNLDNDEILNSFISLITERGKHRTYDRLIQYDCANALSQAMKNNKIRRSYNEKLVETTDTEEINNYSRLFSPASLKPNDVDWVKSKIQKSKNSAIKKRWTSLILEMWRRYSDEATSIFYNVSEAIPDLKEVMGKDLQPINLKSQEACEKRNEYYQYIEDFKIEPVLPRGPQLLLMDLLSEFDNSNDPTVLFNISKILKYKDEYTRSNDVIYTFQETPLWSLLDTNQKKKILHIATLFIQNLERSSDFISLNPTNFSGKDVTILQSFHFLQKEEESVLNTLPKIIWEKVAPVLLRLLPNKGDKEFKTGAMLLKKGFKFSPQIYLNTLKNWISERNKNNSMIFYDHQFEILYSDKLEQLLLNLIKEKKLNIENTLYILNFLLKNNSETTREYLSIKLKEIYNQNRVSENHQTAIIGSSILYLDLKEWPKIWNILDKNETNAKKVFSLIAKQIRDISYIVEILPEIDLAGLFILTHSLYSKDDRRNNETEAYILDEYDNMLDFKRVILYQLETVGTLNSIKALNTILAKFPELKGIHYSKKKAIDNYLNNQVIDYKPSELIEFINSDKKCLVNNGTDFLHVLIQELKLIGESFHIKGAAREVWDKQKNGEWCHISENDFSDYIKRQLDQRFEKRQIVINREVEIDKKSNTDLLIQAISSENEKTISVVIETKGCWHRDLKTAMEKQLLNQYMRRNKYNYGIYLVPRYKCDKCNNNSCSKKHKQMKTEDINKMFENQAEQLSNKSGLFIKSFVIYVGMP